MTAWRMTTTIVRGRIWHTTVRRTLGMLMMRASMCCVSGLSCLIWIEFALT